MLKNLSFSVLLAAAASVAYAGTGSTIRANPAGSAYLQDSAGTIVRSGSGLCWHTGPWTPADAVIGCDGALIPPVTRAIAPPIVPPVAMQPRPAPVPPAPVPPRHCDFSVTLGNDQAFAFNGAKLNPAAKKQIDTEVLSRLDRCAQIALVRIVGHADRLGSQQYNQRLSEKRANAVAAYLKDRGVSARFETFGAGETRPIKSCSAHLRRAALIACLAPNRRVVIEAQGTAK